MKRTLVASVSFVLLSSLGCAAKMANDDSTAPPEENEEELVGAQKAYVNDDDAEDLLEDWPERSELPPRAEPKKKCRGKGKKRKCTLSDPKPGLSAAHGAREFMDRFQWRMEPGLVMKLLEVQLREQYDKKQEGVVDPGVQDQNRSWLKGRQRDLSKGKVRFAEAANHKWGVSLIQYDFADDENEEMIWLQDDDGTKRFYFFKDNELWKVVYAFGVRKWAGKKYEEVVDEQFKPRFGYSPKEKVFTDPKTKAPLLTYLEWKSQEGDVIRAYDQSDVHGVYMIAIIDGATESRIGERLPNAPREDKFNADVGEALGGSDVCYDEDGNMVEDSSRCKELRGY